MLNAHVEMSIQVREGRGPDITLQGRLDEVVDSLRRLYPDLFAVDKEPAGPPLIQVDALGLTVEEMLVRVGASVRANLLKVAAGRDRVLIEVRGMLGERP